MPNASRRKFILNGAQALAIASIGGLVWSSYIQEAKAAPLVLRPPGALSEKDFLKHCIKCGLCVEACPFDTLRLARAGDNMPLGTPYFIPREIPCEMCWDIPCVPVCPTGALERDLVFNKTLQKLDISMAKMGVAVVDQKNCVAYWGIQCDACYRACPLIGEAIYLEYKRNERTGKHSYLLPVVDSDVCTGCGKCEKACITEKAAIFVLPLTVALGKVGTNYIKGWDKVDESRLQEATKTAPNPTQKNNKEVQDYLNSEEF